MKELISIKITFIYFMHSIYKEINQTKEKLDDGMISENLVF